MNIYPYNIDSHLFTSLYTKKTWLAEQIPQSCKTCATFSSHPWAIITPNRYIGYHPDLKPPKLKCQLLFLTDYPVCGLQSLEIAFTRGQKKIRRGNSERQQSKATFPLNWFFPVDLCFGNSCASATAMLRNAQPYLSGFSKLKRMQNDVTQIFIQQQRKKEILFYFHIPPPLESCLHLPASSSICYCICG